MDPARPGPAATGQASCPWEQAEPSVPPHHEALQQATLTSSCLAQDGLRAPSPPWLSRLPVAPQPGPWLHPRHSLVAQVQLCRRLVLWEALPGFSGCKSEVLGGVHFLGCRWSWPWALRGFGQRVLRPCFHICVSVPQAQRPGVGGVHGVCHCSAHCSLLTVSQLNERGLVLRCPGHPGRLSCLLSLGSGGSRPEGRSRRADLHRHVVLCGHCCELPLPASRSLPVFPAFPGLAQGRGYLHTHLLRLDPAPGTGNMAICLPLVWNGKQEMG